MPLLSIIVPVFNAAEYLKDCLDSILTQTFADFELICVNDGSTDNSCEILKEYEQKDPRVIVCNQINKGTASARNTGIKQANGKYITFVDSDDCLEKDTYEEALKYINEADVVCFGITTFGRDYSAKTRKSDDNYYQLKFKGNCLLNDVVIRKTDCSVCNKIFKKSIIEQYSINFPEGLHYEDAEFCWKYFLSSENIYFLKEYFYKYRRHTGSVMHTTFENCDYAIEHLYIIENLYNFLKENNKFESNIQLFIKLFKSSFIFAYVYSPKDNAQIVLETAFGYVDKFFTGICVKDNFIYSLKNRNIEGLFEPELSFMERIFSLKNVYVLDSEYKHKLICILGFKFKIKIPQKTGC